MLNGREKNGWSAPPRAVNEDPDEAGVLLDFHFTTPKRGFETCLKSYMVVYKDRTLLCVLKTVATAMTQATGTALG
jgi:hypothetical protein